MAGKHVSGRRWWARVAALAVCVGAFWSASGLLQFHEVFFSPAAAGAPAAVRPSAEASDAALQPTRQYDRLVVVLIDALRADMVLGSEALYGRTSDKPDERHELSQHMAFTRGLLASGVAAGYVAHASVPTVTMPRLKALLSGKPPAFIDILKNFNSVALADENVVQLLRENGFRIVFYGDDTWLKLFPDAFQRSEGTSGFYTRDTVEVDDNVTRHLRDELDPTLQHPKSRDWDVLVLHYLGLDHVGHLRGPRSALMRDKLHEMDDVVKLVYESVQRQDQARRHAAGENAKSVKPTLIALCSDHGMSEIGNHGGATVEESSALMAFMRGDGKAFRRHEEPKRRLQVDLVPTIAALFGLRIPVYNTGLLLDQIVDPSVVVGSSMTSVELLKALYANFLQLRTLARVKFPDTSVTNPEMAKLDERVRQRLESDSISTEQDKVMVEGLHSACQRLQHMVARSDGSEYDITLVGAGVALLLLCAALSTFFAYNRVRQEGFDTTSFVSRVAIGAFVMTIASLSSTSSIENEHATVFFVTTTFLVAAVVDSAKSNNGTQLRSLFAKVLASLVCLRLLRERSQVINFARLNEISVDSSLPGNEFATDDSLSVWFTGPLVTSVPQQAWITVIYCAVVSGTIRQVKIERLGYVWITGAVAIFTIGMLANAWCGQLIESDDLRENIDFAARCVYGSTLMLVVWGLCGRDKIASSSTEMTLWLLTSMVQKSTNLPSLAVISVLLQLLTDVFHAPAALIRTPFVGLFAIWMSSAAFFALGNSHLVTTIDISQSYHGLQGYSQEIVGALTFINVFSGPLLVFARSVHWFNLSSDRLKGVSTRASVWMMLSYQAFRMATYTIIVFFMRFHLFIWSVFAPKMLYEVVFSVIVAVFVAIIESFK